MPMQNRLFRRGGGYQRVDELSPAARERLTGRARLLTEEEREVQELLKLPCRARLSVVDEETAAIISASERGRLEDEPER